MRARLSEFFISVFDLIAPPRRSERLLGSLTLDELFALSDAEGSLPYRDARVRALVWELKYHAKGKASELAGAYLADLLLAMAGESIEKSLLIPVPMHPERRRLRGHNQTELLCESALRTLRKNADETVPQRRSAVPAQQETARSEDAVSSVFTYAPNILERIRHTTPQQGLMRHKRLRNVKNSMRVTDPAIVRGRACIVVDDVSTTGATLSEARRALLGAGASRVEAVALAH